MKKKNLLLTCLLAALILGGGAKAWCYDFAQIEEHGQTLYYTITSNVEPYTVKVTYPNEKASYSSAAYSGFSKPSGAITIPTTVTDETITYTVTAIDKWAFYNCSSVSSVSIPDGVTTIGQYSFDGCSGLTGITIPNSVETIETYAFHNCYNSKFTDITIPNSVTTIGSNAFEGCSKVTALSIGTGLTTLATNVFKGLTSLTTVTLPSNITTIQSSAFQNCSQLTTIEGPGVTTIAISAFATCSKLTTINFPALVSISNKAFDSCTSLESVTIPSTVTSISGNPFYGCTSLATITVDPTNTKYTSGDGANCIVDKTNNYLLTGCLGTTIPEGVVRICDYAFYNYSGLTSINIPSTVTYIGTQAFYGCKLASLALPEGLTTIKSQAFYNNNTLNSIIIPSTVTIIENYSFQLCTSLTSVIVLRESIPTLGDKVFYKSSMAIIDGLTIYVPSNKVSAYESASNWSTYASNINDDGVFVYKSAGDWTTAANWSTEPASGADVYIIANCTIPTSSDITITNMYIPNGVTLTINDGSKLTATNINNIGGSESLVIANSGQLICNNAVAATVQKNISSWGSKSVGGWNFIASPIAGLIDPKDAGLITDNYTSENLPSQNDATYDLYYLDMTAEKDHEWQNYRKNAFNLANGKGYLYANVGTPTLNFSGNIQPSDDPFEITGLYSGYNLVGNPFTCNAYLNRSYYTLNSDGSAVVVDIAKSDPIAPCTGVIIDNSSVTFSKNSLAIESANNGNLQMVLAQNVATRGERTAQTLDKAIVSFNEGSQLGKFYFGTQDANLYIPQDNEEYAIVSSSAQGEMPVNFKAHRDGQYTLTVNPEEVEMGYLHLIDNIAGTDVDLLANPSYTFNARNDDYESRFRLVFSANMVNADLNDDFAFFSNGQLVIANEGESLLQVIDVNGRIVTTESVNGTCSKAINVKAGVYVLRLIQGTDVKTQKIVVR